MPSWNEKEIGLLNVLTHWDRSPSKVRLKWPEEFRVSLLGLLAEGKEKCIVIVHQHSKDARSTKEWLESSLKQSPYRPHHWAHLDYWNDQRHSALSVLIAERMATLAALTNQEHVVICTTADALLSLTTSKDWFSQTNLCLRHGEDLGPEDLVSRFLSFGYSKVSRVEEPGTFYPRGSILDVYPVGGEDAYRIEFIDDTISAIKVFSTETQRSSLQTEKISISPFSEFLCPPDAYQEGLQKFYNVLLETNLTLGDRNNLLASYENRRNLPQLSKYFESSEIPKSSLVDYLNHPLWFIDGDPSSLISLALERGIQAYEPKLRTFSSEILAIQEASLRVRSQTLVKRLEDKRSLVVGGLVSGRPEIAWPQKPKGLGIDLSKDKKDLFHSLKTETDRTWIIFCETSSRLGRVENVLKDLNIDVSGKFDSVLASFEALPIVGVYLVLGVWTEATTFKKGNLISFVPSDLLVHDHGDRKAKRKSPLALDVRSLRHGDFVAHEDHGIGKFLGNVLMSVGGMTLDCLAIEYLDGDKIYVPVTGLGKLEKYSESDSPVSLDKLSGLGWFKRREKARASAKIAAEELLKIQALRKATKHTPYGEPSDLYLKFCREFPFQETNDQLLALEDIEADLVSPMLMDRLVIGDVGFGKTELAIRAAYRTVLEGKQVLMICPTTILSHQHYATFKARMQPFGVKVSHLNRFVKASEKEKTLQSFAFGQIDVLIGTHILLGKKIEPENLGLLVVDEEQKFGVGHKENIKKLRGTSDVLTLSATPIPRTLHMATAGLKEVSLLSTPPKNRIPVRNSLAKWDRDLIADAIRLELNRGGQVFVVHNRIEDIGIVEARIRDFVPEASVRIAHGKLDAGDLERIMVDFLDQKFNILLATAIIESGVDIPNVNTIIINNAHQFGLSQLYQLRGRVGRSNVQGFAYLITPDEQSLSKEAQARLEAIMGHQELGSGFYVSSRDLEIRGAGNVLGAEQSGFVESVGIELYARLLATELKKLSGQEEPIELEPEIKLGISAFIPEEAISDEAERIKYYRYIFKATSLELLEDIREEVTDRFGAPTDEFECLFQVGKIRILLKKIGAQVISKNVTGTPEIKFGPLDSSRLERLINLSQKNANLFRILPDFRMTFPRASELEDVIYRLKLAAGEATHEV
jgi:transcription-repair coupling factor (superfamily II helicase)